jgi:glycosyltransferase involved in cell wall biosynthesis
MHETVLHARMVEAQRMSDPLISIPITAYKSQAAHLSAAIESAVTQTWQKIEVIVSDDSPDQSLRAVVDQFHDPRVRYRHNSPALGVARNHWSCFREAKGEFIAVLNHDDLFSPTFLERLLPPLRENPELALAFCDHWVISVDGSQLIEETERVSAFWGRSKLAEGIHRPFFDLFAAQTIPMVMGAVFCRSLLPEGLPDQAGPADDLWFTYMLCRQGHGAYYVRDRLSSWRAHPGNVTSQGGADWSYGAAECWNAVTRDSRLSSIHPVARQKAAESYSSCAVSWWRGGQRLRCFRYGWQSLRMQPTWKGFISYLLPMVPTRLVNYQQRKAAGGEA